MSEHKPRSWYPETLAIHAGRRPDPTTGAVMAPLHLSTTYLRDGAAQPVAAYSYSRDGHPNSHTVEATLAALDAGADACVFSSGVAAAQAVFETLPRGSRVVATADSYYGTRRQLDDLAARGWLEPEYVDTSDTDAVARALERPTALVWIETPSNPMLRIADLAAIAKLTAPRGTRLACDGTLATPIGQQPLALGADLVVHSATKYLGGHSDLLGGVVVSRVADDAAAAIRERRSVAGAMLAPFDCWLLGRSLATLPWRVRAQCDSALRIATALEGHPALRAVIYPGLAAHPGHARACVQMRTFGAMISLRVAAGRTAALAMTGHLELFATATSLGGVESLVEHRASIEGPNTATPDDLLRLSVGLEHPDDLLADLHAALEAVA